MEFIMSLLVSQPLHHLFVLLKSFNHVHNFTHLNLLILYFSCIHQLVIFPPDSIPIKFIILINYFILDLLLIPFYFIPHHFSNFQSQFQLDSNLFVKIFPFLIYHFIIHFLFLFTPIILNQLIQFLFSLLIIIILPKSILLLYFHFIHFFQK